MDNLTKAVVVFNSKEVLDYLSSVFDATTILYCKVHDNYMYARFNNGSDFSIEIVGEAPAVFKIEIRSKCTSLEPDFKAEIYFENNTAYIIKYLIKPKIEELLNKLKEAK